MAEDSDTDLPITITDQLIMDAADAAQEAAYEAAEQNPELAFEGLCLAISHIAVNSGLGIAELSDLLQYQMGHVLKEVSENSN